MTTNSAVKRKLASVLSNCSECFEELVMSFIFLHDQLNY